MRTLTAIVALAASAWAVTAGAGDGGGGVTVAPPLPWQEPAPLARLFLQLPFEAPEVLPAGRSQLELRLLYSNTLLAAENERLILEVDVETAQPTVLLRRGLLRGVEAQLAVPFVVDYGGYLDRPIELAEELFHATNPQRSARPRDAARFQLARRGGAGISESGPGAGVGDVWAGLKVSVADDGRGGVLAVRGALKLPTGRLPYGSEELDLGASVLGGFRWGSSAVRLQLDLMVPTADLPVVHVKTRPYGTVNLGLTRRLGARVALQLQGSAHLSPLADTGLGQLDGATAYVLGGATVALGRRVELQAGVAENIFSPYRGADVTFLVGLATRR